MNYILIDASLALVALLVGFYSALWYVRSTGTGNGNSQVEEQEARERAARKNDAERASMAASQLRDLAKNVALDVGEHNSLVNGISSQLGTMNPSSADAGAAVATAVAKILSANEKLQDRLNEAEKKIQAQAEEIRSQQSEALTDSLTKLANRRAFDEAIGKNMRGFKNQRKPFSLLIFDVDHFKKFNDTHGHQAGDEVLRCVSQTLTETVKTTDIPCRYGGEEFAVIFQNTKIDSARLSAERIRKAIEERQIEFEGKKLKVTASVGVAEILQDEDETKLIRRSDDCVYAAKAAGRNQSYWNDGTHCLPLHVDSPKAQQEASEATKAENKEGSFGDSSKLPTSQVFSGELQRRVSESHRFGVSLSVMRIGIRDFKNLALEYGDAVGHLLLDSVAQFIRSSLRDMDLLGQLEPGQFVVMLPGSSEKEALIVGTRVESAISNCAIPLGDKQLKLSVEYGVTDVYPDDDASSMIERAAAIMTGQGELAQAK